MTTYNDIVGRLTRLLKDPDQATYDEDICFDAITAAHRAILPWVPKLQVAVLTAGSDGDTFNLPTDVYEMQAVQTISDYLFIPKATLAYGTARGNPNAQNDWIEAPDGYLSLSTALSENAQINLYYFAFWGEPPLATSSTFPIEVPKHAHNGMVYYAASHCLLTASLDAASIGQFKTRVDSGNPEHNPLKEMSTFYRRLFETEMKLMPTYAKAAS
jgi:hypothetical protein